ncbi:hypothetical protein AR438_13520 [Chryseobacterium aquaticum]|uniref:Uncharacterized protein n=1 Tax=Chryseobacterium aquaticum TaxID=452084 RepID=A0A0Q3HQB1_9FLAO|nr:hypothetical protein [Chryseobacterium aquaticum]KQK24943.1 hypothetical protein AR438_13520 [Chryseobacterium aquaticum]
MHELLGHGVMSAFNVLPQLNNANAIRMTNLIRRIMNSNSPSWDGSNHSGGPITTPQNLPLIK